jgi:ferredoxin--NADP+ reductase
MVDGTGMCGGCRVSVGGRTLYACVDGPEFDGLAVDFDELAGRLGTYRDFEKAALEARHCLVRREEPVVRKDAQPLSVGAA